MLYCKILCTKSHMSLGIQNHTFLCILLYTVQYMMKNNLRNNSQNKFACILLSMSRHILLCRHYSSPLRNQNNSPSMNLSMSSDIPLDSFRHMRNCNYFHNYRRKRMSRSFYIHSGKKHRNSPDNQNRMYPYNWLYSNHSILHDNNLQLWIQDWILQ